MSYTGPDGSFFFAAHDIDGEVASATQTLTFSGINVAGFTNLNFSASFAEDDDGSNQDWDNGDIVFVEAQIDGGGYTKILQIANDGTTFNTVPQLDTNLDGIGDGAAITDVFQRFSGAISNTGTVLDIRITFTLNSGDEDLAIDLIEVTGDAPTGPAPGDTLFCETFETDGNGSRYTTSTMEFSDGFGDYFTRTDGSTIGTFIDYGTPEGSFFFAAHDIDGEGAAATQTITFNPIDISGASALRFEGLFSEDDDGGNQDWDNGDLFFIEARIDGGAWVKVIQFANDGATFNTEPQLDTNFDGIGDGAPLTSSFQLFTAPITGTGANLELRASFTLDSGDEDIAIDNLKVLVDAPQPPCIINLDDAVATDETAPGASDGTITITASGATNLAYTIGGPTSTNPVFTNLGPGSYTVIAIDTDKFNCADTTTVNIEANTNTGSVAMVLCESFETDGNGSRYTTSIPEFSDGVSDFFTRN